MPADTTQCGCVGCPTLGPCAVVGDLYQLSFKGALAAGSFDWGWLGTKISLSGTLISAALMGLVLAFLVRGYSPPARQP